MTVCVCGTFGHGKLISGSSKHEAVPLHLGLYVDAFYHFIFKNSLISNRLIWGKW